MDHQDDAAAKWLLASDEPAIRYLTRRDVLGEDVLPDDDEILRGPKVRALLAENRRLHPYRKWYGAHLRLVSLVELAVSPGHPAALAALETVLTWLTGDAHRAGIRTIRGRTRVHASQEGNALAVATRLGCADDPRVELLAHRSSSGSGRTAAGTSTSRPPDTGPRSTSRSSRCGGSSSLDRL